MKTLSFIFSMLFSMVLTVHSQPTPSGHNKSLLDFLPTVFSNSHVEGKKPTYAFAIPIDSLTKKVLAYQKQVHPKKTVLSNGKTDTDITQLWNGNAWVNNGRRITTTDAFGNVMTKSIENWNDSVWGNNALETFLFDGNGNNTSDLFQRWNSVEWINYTRVLNAFDGNGHNTDFLWEIWNDTGWVVNSHYIYTYDANGYETS